MQLLHTKESHRQAEPIRIRSDHLIIFYLLFKNLYLASGERGSTVVSGAGYLKKTSFPQMGEQLRHRRHNYDVTRASIGLITIMILQEGINLRSAINNSYKQSKFVFKKCMT